MFKLHLTSRSRSTSSLVLGILCVLLMAFTATIQVVHAHDLDAGPHPECSLCVVAHASISPSAPIELPAVIEHVEEIQVESTQSPCDSFVFSFYSRPPPAETASL